MITNGSRFTRDSHFEQLTPIYAVAAQEIEDIYYKLLQHSCEWGYI